MGSCHARGEHPVRIAAFELGQCFPRHPSRFNHRDQGRPSSHRLVLRPQSGLLTTTRSPDGVQIRYGPTSARQKRSPLRVSTEAGSLSPVTQRSARLNFACLFAPSNFPTHPVPASPHTVDLRLAIEGTIFPHASRCRWISLLGVDEEGLPCPFR